MAKLTPYHSGGVFVCKGITASRLAVAVWNSWNMTPHLIYNSFGAIVVVIAVIVVTTGFASRDVPHAIIVGLIAWWVGVFFTVSNFFFFSVLLLGDALFL